jgi:hypothetical protein
MNRGVLSLSANSMERRRKVGRDKRLILLDFGSPSTGTIAVLSFFALAAAHLGVAHRSDLPAFVGDRSEAIFDLWSLQHFCAGVLLGAILLRCKFLRLETWKELAVAAALFAFAWEAAELAMEAGLFGQVVASWKDGFEHWSNRLFGDPLTVTSGALIANRFPQAWKIVLLPAVIWLLMNVISPNSMYIQRLLFG